MNHELPRTHTAIAYWLTPADPAHTFFENMICDLARQYDAPVFEPHVTIHVGSNHAEAAEKATSQAAFVCEPIELKLLDQDTRIARAVQLQRNQRIRTRVGMQNLEQRPWIDGNRRLLWERQCGGPCDRRDVRRWA